MDQWQLQQAKARLSEVLRRAQAGSPQAITVHGKNEAVVLSWKQYERLAERKRPFVEFMRRSPWAGVELELERDRSPTRKVRL
jgi:prevent-host-death family protein